MAVVDSCGVGVPYCVNCACVVLIFLLCDAATKYEF